MVSGQRRYYKAGVREALFMLSRGRCYAPKCPQRVLRMVDDDPSVNIQIAHINGLNPGSARYDSRLPVEKRNSFGNLLLLCQAHHGPVDDKSKEDKYTKKVLLGWKKDREGAFYQQLAGLDVLGVEDLEAMLVSAVTETKQEILHAIDQVAPTVSANVVTTLRKLMAETFDQPYLDLDAVAMLADAASSLRHLPDSAPMLATRRACCTTWKTAPPCSAVLSTAWGAWKTTSPYSTLRRRISARLWTGYARWTSGTVPVPTWTR